MGVTDEWERFAEGTPWSEHGLAIGVADEIEAAEARRVLDEDRKTTEGSLPPGQWIQGPSFSVGPWPFSDGPGHGLTGLVSWYGVWETRSMEVEG